MSKKSLIAYFSVSGHTKEAAHMLAETAHASIYEIKPEVPYKKGDLNWLNPFARSSKEMKGKLPYPELADKEAKIADYDVIFLGFPIWWHVAPTIINKFLESYDFSNKTIVLFATSGGSSFGKTIEKLKDSVADSTKIIEGRLMNGNFDQEELAAWCQNILEK